MTWLQHVVVRRFVPELAAAVAGTALFLAFVDLRGWAVGVDWGVYGLPVPEVAVMVVPFVAAGSAVAAAGWRRGLRVTPPLVVLGFVAGTYYPPLQPDPSLVEPARELAFPVMVIGVLGTLLVGIEYGLRNRPVVGRFYTRRSLRAGLVAGTLPFVVFVASQLAIGKTLSHLVFSVVVGTFVRSPLFATVTALWFLPGVVLLFGVPVALLVHPRLVSPAVVVYGLVALALYLSSLSQASLGAGLVLIGVWFLPLGLGLLAGGGEAFVRRWYRRTRGGGKPTDAAEG